MTVFVFRHKIRVRNKCCARGQTGKLLCRQQCVLVCQGLYESVVCSKAKISLLQPSCELSLIYLHLSFSAEVVEYETMSKDVNRSAYTRRILEIVGNIKKQKEEINKVGGCPVQSQSCRKWSLRFRSDYA